MRCEVTQENSDCENSPLIGGAEQDRRSGRGKKLTIALISTGPFPASQNRVVRVLEKRTKFSEYHTLRLVLAF